MVIVETNTIMVHDCNDVNTIMVIVINHNYRGYNQYNGYV